MTRTSGCAPSNLRRAAARSSSSAAPVGFCARGVNTKRTNRMLPLIQLHLNGQDNELTHSHSIREAIAADDGKSAPRGLIPDPSGYSSLWS